MRRIVVPNMQTVQKAYAVLAFASAVIGLGEKLYNQYHVINKRRRKRHFGFHS